MKTMLKIAISCLAFFGITANTATAQGQYKISYGNNLNLTPAADYASQFRYMSEGEMHKVSLTPQTDIPTDVPVEWSVEILHQMKYTTINSKTGVLALAKGGYRAANSGLVVVKALVGKGTPREETLSVPVFFNFPAANPADETHDYGYMISYTPFVMQVDPKTGGKSGPATVAGEGFDAASFSLDYRRDHNYYNLNGPASHEGGVLTNPDSNQEKLLYQVWGSYYENTGRPLNTGDKRPVSYFANRNALDKAACYVDNADSFKVVVNPGKWVDNKGNHANGIYLGQMTYCDQAQGEAINNGPKQYPFFIWFDEKF